MAYIDNVTNILQIQPGGLPTFVRLSQNENGRNLYFQLAGNEIDIPANATITISGTKPDGTVYSGTGSISDNVILIPEMIQMTAVAGYWDAKVKIISGGNTIATGRIRFVIDADTVDPDSVPSDSELEGLVAEAQQYAETARAEAYGSPLTATTAAGMTDHTRVYVYTGSETGYTAGHWYFWNGSAWTDGGIYNSTAVNTDPTLTLAGVAADAKATGDAIEAARVTIDDTLTNEGEAADAAAVGSEISGLKEDLSLYDEVFESGSVVYDLTYTNNAMNDTTGQQSVANSKRASTPALYYFPDYCELHASWNATNQAIWLYCFDKDKSYLGYVGANQIANGIVSLKPGTRYIRFFIVNKNNSDISVSDAKQYAAYTCVYIGRLTDTDAELNMLSEKVDKIVVNNNLLASYEMNNGYFNGSPHASSDYVYFAKIPVENGKTYITYPTSRMVYIYASDGSLINYLNQQDITSITAGGDGYAYVTYYTSTNLESIGFYEENADDVYGRNSYALADNIIIPSILTGKKWAVLGDSFTAGADTGTIQDGTYAGNKIVYPYLIGNRTGINVLSFFASGRTLAYPAEPGDFINSVTCPGQSYYYQNIPEDVDYVTIYLGINDSHHAPASSGGDGEDHTGEIPIGTINDDTTATYYGAWNVVLTWLRNNRPFAHVGMIVSNGCETAEYRTAQLAIAKKYGIPYIDTNGDDRTPAMIRPQNDDIASAVKTILLQTQAVDYAGGNLHPNNAAHEFESYFIEAFLRSL